MNECLSKLRDTVFRKVDPSHPIFRIIYHLCKVRGWKIIVRFLGHDVSDLIPLVNFMEQTQESNWHAQYVGSLWLSLVVRIPFSLNGFNVSGKEMIPRILEISLNLLFSPAKQSETAAEALARVFTRVDVLDPHFSQFLSKFNQTLENKPNQFQISGYLRAICATLKYGDPNNFSKKFYALRDIVDNIRNMPAIMRNSIVRKLCVKLEKRIVTGIIKALKPGHDIDVTLIERVIENMLASLADQDSAVRWAAAKCISEVTKMLDSEFLEDVLTAVFSLTDYSKLEADTCAQNSWHGVLLTLAELSRNRKLPTNRLSEAMRVISEGLVFELDKGTHSIGSNVRDAACYACWSFARCFGPDVMKRHVAILSNNLVCVAILDREVNVRRAASAAFQENVGRQGSFPQGLQIIAIADFFSVGNIKNCYIDLSRKIAIMDEYRFGLIETMTKKLCHWDPQIRQLAAAGLGNLTELDRSHYLDHLIPNLTKGCFAKDFRERHGSLLALSSIIAHLMVTQSQTKHLCTQIKDLISTYARDCKNYLQAYSHEALSGALCILIKEFVSGIGSDEVTIDTEFYADILYIIFESSEKDEEDVQKASASACSALLGTLPENDKERTVQTLINKCSKEHAADKLRGNVILLGSAHVPLEKSFVELLSALEKIIGYKSGVSRDCLVKKYCIRSLSELFSYYSSFIKQPILVSRVFYLLVRGINDYSIDHRGDVGSWVREASAESLVEVYSTINDRKLSNIVIKLSTLKIILAKLTRLMVEKIDRLRKISFNAFKVIVGLEICDSIDNVAAIRKSLTIVSSQPSNNEIICFASTIFNHNIFTRELLCGFAYSIGGLNGDTSHLAYEHLSAQFEDHSSEESISTKFNLVLEILDDLYLRRRIFFPMLETMHLLKEKPRFIHVIRQNPKEIDRIFTLVSDELRKVRDLRKLNAAVKFACSYVFEAADKKSLLLRMDLVLQLIGHEFPTVRSCTAEELYFSLMNIEEENDFSSEVYNIHQREEFQKILAENDWRKNLDELSETRNELLKFLV